MVEKVRWEQLHLAQEKGNTEPQGVGISERMVTGGAFCSLNKTWMKLQGK